MKTETIEERRALLGHFFRHDGDMRRALMRKSKPELVQMLMGLRLQLELSRIGYKDSVGELMDEKRARSTKARRIRKMDRMMRKKDKTLKNMRRD